MGLFYAQESKQQLFGHANAEYLSDHIKTDHKQGMCLIVMDLLFQGDPLSKQWRPHHRIIQKL